ncbi:hypothetical protein ABW19_dt0206451 [Dactylella cylindrospora]|nr:hypothetical protein ABW19_dt0206451 [Dactylella cylindrospora]
MGYRKLQRNLKTGLVEDVDVESDSEELAGDPDKKEMKQAYYKILKEYNSVPPFFRAMHNSESSEELRIGLEADFDEVLFVGSDGDQGSDNQPGCANARDRPGLWNGTYDIKKTSPDIPFLNRLAYGCRGLKVRQCNNRECINNREKISKVAPKCEWPRFREWAIGIAGCLSSFDAKGMATQPYFHLARGPDTFQWMLEDYQNHSRILTGLILETDGKKRTIDIFGVTEVIYWLLSGVDNIFNTHPYGNWRVDYFLSGEVTEPAITKALSQSKELGLCPARVWGFAAVSSRNQIDLPSLMETAIKHPKLRHIGHEQCTDGFCATSKMDSTKVDQLHHCDGEECQKQGRLLFDPKLLNDSIKNGGRTVWSLSEPFEVYQSGGYVAISHVWSDGTGVGLQPVGQVNKCLFDYFAGLVKGLGYNGIWWDTISIPSDREARHTAISKMHDNYSNAAATILHDRYLADFYWTEDGSPCLALLFSPWITRGWTALELLKSTNMLVIFKGPDGKPVLKSLKDDVLAKTAYHSTRAHWMASTIIRRLCAFDEDDLSDLMAILKPRTTSWEGDRIMIAALLAGLEDIPKNLMEMDITKLVINKMYQLNRPSLLHGKVTITDTGGWSWCPRSLYEMPLETYGDFAEAGLGSQPCLVDKDGVLVGRWHYRGLTAEEVAEGRILSVSRDMTVIRRTKDALNRWQNCLLLRETNRGGSGIGFLVIPVNKTHESIYCKFMGAVHDVSPKPAEGYDDRYWYHRFRIGVDGEEMRAKDIIPPEVDPYQIQPGRTFDVDLWIGDGLGGPFMLIGRDPEVTGRRYGYLLSVPSATEASQAVKTSDDTKKRVYYCNPVPKLAPRPIFTIDKDDDGNIIPDSKNIVESPEPNKIRVKGYPPITFTAIHGKCHRPNPWTKYIGIWAEEGLFELSKFTKAPPVKQPIAFLKVDNIKATEGQCSEGEWAGSPTVSAVIYPGLRDDDLEQAELILVSGEEIVVSTKDAFVQMKRINIDMLV